jgi:hypothetical protein
MTATAQAAHSRAETNRTNAQKSTGPRSPFGKSRVKFNALKHGMRAKTILLPGEDEAAFRGRLDAWTVALDPRDEIEQFLVTRAVEVSWKLDRVRVAIAAQRTAARYAHADRLAEQAEQVVAMGRRLFWDPIGPLCLYPHGAGPNGEAQRVSYSGDPEDPDDPARLVVRLEAMALGCAWLLERWDELREILEAGLLWQPHDRLKAVRMLGRQPLEAVDDKRVMTIYLSCWTMDPADQHGFGDQRGELAAKETKLYVDRLNAREPLDGAPASPEEARAALLALIVEEEERLEGILDGHLEREEAESQASLAFDDGAYGERLRKYELENDRTLLRIVETLRKRRQKADEARPPAPARSAESAAQTEVASVQPTDLSPSEPIVDTPPTRDDVGPEQPVDLTHPAADTEPAAPECLLEQESRTSAERVAKFSAAILAAFMALFVMFLGAGSTPVLAITSEQRLPYHAPRRPTGGRVNPQEARNKPWALKVMSATGGRARNGPPTTPA